MIKSISLKQAETKHTIYNASDGTQYTHMSLNDLDANPWYTTQGITDPNGATNGTYSAANRIGDVVMAKGVRYRIFLENNERFSDVKHRFIFVRCERGMVISNTNLFCGRSDNKMIDDINRETHTVLFDRTYSIKSPNMTTYAVDPVQDISSLVGHGTYHTSAATVQNSSQPGSRIITIYVPYHKSNTYRKLVYSDNNDPKFYDYHLLYMPYVVQNTSTTLNVAKINDFNKVFYFKDP